MGTACSCIFNILEECPAFLDPFSGLFARDSLNLEGQSVAPGAPQLPLQPPQLLGGAQGSEGDPSASWHRWSLLLQKSWGTRSGHPAVQPLLLRLMKASCPQQVLGLLLQQGHLQHKSSKVHEELDNTVVLCTYPAEELDVAKLLSGLKPALVESKRRIQHADMKCLLWWPLPRAQAKPPFSSRQGML